MESKKPWTIEGMPWKSEAAFWNWVKGTIRKGWSRHPVRSEYIKQRRFKINKSHKNGKVSQIWGMKCEICAGTFPQAKMQIDHIHPSDLERWYDDISSFVKRMFIVTFEDLQALCIPCHAVKTYQDKMGITWEEALREKEVILVCNEKAAYQKKWLEERGIRPASNAGLRREQIRTILKEK